MIEVNYTIDCLERTPLILSNLLNQIPKALYKIRRLENKRNIHELICHLADAQIILTERFRMFETTEDPLITTYTPPSANADDQCRHLNTEDRLNAFSSLRSEMIRMLRGFDENYWKLKGRHEVYTPYSTKILLIHSLNVDYAHIFSIEQVGLTKPGFEREIMTFL